MSNLYYILTGLCEKRRITPYRMCRDTGIQPSVMTDLKMGRRQTVKAETAAKLADYFGVTVRDLLGAQEPIKVQPLPQELLKIELFGGEATDQQLEEVRQFAKFVKERDAGRP